MTEQQKRDYAAEIKNSRIKTWQFLALLERHATLPHIWVPPDRGFTDEGDILVSWGKEAAVVMRRIELTFFGQDHKAADFDYKENWPFPNFYIDQPDKLDRQQKLGVTPWISYIKVNAEMTHCAAIFPNSFAEWSTPERSHDRGRGYERDWVTCPMNYVKFYPLVVKPKAKELLADLRMWWNNSIDPMG